MLSSGRKQNSICQLSIILRGFIQCWYARGGGSSQRNEPLDPPLRTVLSEIRLVKRSPTLSAELLKPRLHDTTVERTATVRSTGCQTGLYNRIDNRLYRVNGAWRSITLAKATARDHCILLRILVSHRRQPIKRRCSRTFPNHVTSL